MFAYLARRLLLTVPVLLGVATLIFALIHFIPGDPARAILGDAASETDIAQLRQQLGLDRPLAVQYVAFLGGLARADLGTSLRTGTPVAGQILERLPATFELALAAIAVALVVAIPLGIAAAVWRGTVVDHTAMTLSLAGVSMPNFWLGPLLAIVFKNSIRKRRSIRSSTTDHPVDANYTRHVRVAWVHPANVRAAGCVIADRVVFPKEKGVVSPRVCAEFRIIVQRA